MRIQLLFKGWVSTPIGTLKNINTWPQVCSHHSQARGELETLDFSVKPYALIFSSVPQFLNGLALCKALTYKLNCTLHEWVTSLGNPSQGQVLVFKLWTQMQGVSGVPVKLKQIIPNMVSTVITVSLKDTTNFFLAPEFLTKYSAVDWGLLWNTYL